MGIFCKENHFVRHFPERRDARVLTVGYDDFSTVKPLYAFRVQNIYTWHFVLSGSGNLEIDEKVYPLTEGQMFFIPPGIKMRYYPNQDDPWEYVWFTLSEEAAQQYLPLLGFSEETPASPGKYFHKIRRSLQKMLDSLADGSGYFSVLSCFYEILEICTCYTPRTGIQKIREHIDDTFAMPGFRIEQLCRDVGISHAQLLRLFKQTYGVTLKRYVTQKRIELACELLTGTDLSVSSVAFSCGFADEIHFMKIFKKETGSSALQYRKITVVH